MAVSGKYLIYICTSLLIIACTQSSTSDQTVTEVPVGCFDSGTSLLDSNIHFPLGVAVKTGQYGGDLKDSLFENSCEQHLVGRHFDMLVAENAMKFLSLQPTAGDFKWEHADKLVEYALEHGKKLHGHTLIWYKDTTEVRRNWLEGYQGDWGELLDNHVSKVVKHFEGKISSWDVVNENFEKSESNGEYQHRQDNLWHQNVPDFTARAFRAAAKADPSAELYYNDYNLAVSNKKRKRVLEMIAKLKDAENSVKIDGVGFQLHINLLPESGEVLTYEKISKAFNDFIDKKLKIRISELDIRIGKSGQVPELTEELMQRQADLYKDVISAYFDVPPQWRGGISFWGLADGNLSNENWPNMFKEDYSPKPAFYAVRDALRENPRLSDNRN